jgi:hypothetical protein
MARWLEKWRGIVVSDAYRLLPRFDVLMGGDREWWAVHKGCPSFEGEKWSSHEHDIHGTEFVNDKRVLADQYDLNLVTGRDGDEFSFDPKFIRYGSNTGFQAINLALLFGCRRIVLVGFNLCHVAGQAHFFGDHPQQLRRTKDEEYRGFVKHYERAARRLPKDVSIVNATPNSALDCFPRLSLEDALRTEVHRDGLPDRDRAESQAAAG